MILSVILWILFGASLAGIFFVIGKKVPILVMLPDDTLEYKETFIVFLKRKRSELPLRIGRIKIDFLTEFHKKLVKIKILSLKIHNITNAWTETLNRKLHHSKMRQEEQIKEQVDRDKIDD